MATLQEVDVWVTEILEEYQAASADQKVDISAVRVAINRAIERKIRYQVIRDEVTAQQETLSSLQRMMIEAEREAEAKLWDAGIVETVIRAQKEFGKFEFVLC